MKLSSFYILLTCLAFCGFISNEVDFSNESQNSFPKVEAKFDLIQIQQSTNNTEMIKPNELRPSPSDTIAIVEKSVNETVEKKPYYLGHHSHHKEHRKSLKSESHENTAAMNVFKMNKCAWVIFFIFWEAFFQKFIK